MTIRAYPIVIYFREQNDVGDLTDGAAAIANPDGSWWIDWPRLERMATGTVTSNHDYAILMARVVLAARGTLIETTRERADELAVEWAEQLDRRERESWELPPSLSGWRF